MASTFCCLEISTTPHIENLEFNVEDAYYSLPVHVSAPSKFRKLDVLLVQAAQLLSLNQISRPNATIIYKSYLPYRPPLTSYEVSLFAFGRPLFLNLSTTASWLFLSLPPSRSEVLSFVLIFGLRGQHSWLRSSRSLGDSVPCIPWP